MVEIQIPAGVIDAVLGGGGGLVLFKCLWLRVEQFCFNFRPFSVTAAGRDFSGFSSSWKL